MKLSLKLFFALCFYFQNILILTKPSKDRTPKMQQPKSYDASKKDSFRKIHNLRITIPETITGFEKTHIIEKHHNDLDWSFFKVVVAALVIGTGFQLYQQFQNRPEKSTR